MTERISLDGEPLDEEAFVRRSTTSRRTPTSSTTSTTTRCRSSRPRRDGVRRLRGCAGRRRGRRGRHGRRLGRDQRIDAKVAVLTPIAVDHAKYLGETLWHRPREGRHHQARRDGRDRGPVRGGHALVVERCTEVARPWPARVSSSASPAGCSAVFKAFAAATTRSSSALRRASAAGLAAVSLPR